METDSMTKAEKHTFKHPYQSVDEIPDAVLRAFDIRKVAELLDAAQERVRELEGELDVAKRDAKYQKIVAARCEKETRLQNEQLSGVHAGTHVIVPVEPIIAMLKASQGGET